MGYKRGRVVLTISLPYLPPKELSPNSRLYFLDHGKKIAKNMVRDDIHMLVREQEWKKDPLESAVVRFKWGLPDKRRRDMDNLLASCKTHLDALVKQGVLVDDSWQHVELELGCFYSKGQPQTIIEVMCYTP